MIKIKAPEDIYPLTIVRDRYNGMYSGGIYTAFNLTSDDIPDKIFWGDCDCEHFWSQTDIVCGKGDTPDSAMNDLYNNLTSVRNEPL